MASRTYTTRRKRIVVAIVEALKGINGDPTFQSDVDLNVQERLRFWDEINQFPEIQVNAGNESREYLPGNFKWRFLNLTIRIYVKDEDDSEEALALLLEDIETILEDSGTLQYIDNDGVTQTLTDITIISISTDEGVLAPLGVGEIVLEVRY